MRNAIVIGSGLSGLMGALALADAGQRPYVLSKGQGITHWTGGTIDILGTTDGQSPRQAVESLVGTYRDHPYARVGLAGVEAAIDRFRALMESANYPYVGSLDQNMLLPTAIGALRPAAYAPATMAAGDMRQDGEMLIAGFRELRDFFPPMAAANLRAQGFAAHGEYLTLPSMARRLDYTTRIFAFLFDDPKFRKNIGEQLAKLRGNATRIGLPAVLGLRDPMGVVRELQEISGAHIFEIPTLPGSVPGMRLFKIFQDAIVAGGGRLQLGSKVMRGEGENGSLATIYSKAAAREQPHRAKAFLLATGGIGGGGIRTDYTGAVWDTALGLPLHKPDSHSEWFRSRFLHESGHPIFQSGIVTDGQMRPLDINGSAVYQNVLVAGAAMAYIGTMQDRSITGIPLTTGWRAGQLLAEMVGAGG
jgi:glycerol-3-phosphate dehydrogenase subunit B